MSREVAFNLQLARIDRIGFHRCVMFSNLVGAPHHQLPTQAGDVMGETVSRPKQAHPQLHRTNRRSFDPERYDARLASKRRYNLTYNERRRELRRQARERQHAIHLEKLSQMALALETES